MKNLRRFNGLLAASALAVLILLPALALAGPRSGGSFGGRGGFRSGGGFSSGRSFSRGSRGYGGPNIIVAPGFGWGWGFSPFGFGGGGCGPVGTLAMLAVLGITAVAVMRAIRRGSYASEGDWEGDEERVTAMPGRGYVYKVQIGLGRSARGIQGRLARFAAEGDTATEAGLAQLLQQTSLELLREKHSIRYAGVEPAGPMTLTNTETKMNGIALAERSRFQVERVRGADGKVRRSEAAAEEGSEVLEYVLVTLVVATRTPLAAAKPITEREAIDALLSELGGVAPSALLGIEVIWTPADENDSLTETDLHTTYPDLRSV